MNKVIVLVTGVLILLVANYAILNRETLLSDGEVVILPLAPVDPRSLMQGDFMALRFQAARSLSSDEAHNGFVVLTLDDNRVGTFARVDQGEPLKENEIRMSYKVRQGQVKFATDAFFFQEGDAQLYEAARFGEFRVADNGDSLLVAMRGADLKRLGRAL